MMMRLQRRLLSLAWLVGLLMCSVIGSSIAPTPGIAADAVVGPELSATSAPTETSAVLAARLTPDAAGPFEAQDRDAVTAFYAARQFLPLWVDEHGPTRAAKRAIAELGHAAEWGLQASDFKLVAANQPFTAGQWSSAQTADAELEITAAILRYAHQAQGGRIPEPAKLLSSYLDREPAISSASEILARIATDANPDDVLRSFQPSQDQFLKLKALLATLRGVSTATAESFPIPAGGPMLQSGVRHADVAVLKKRFGLVSEPGAEDLFDDGLVGAIKSFQAAKGVASDGIVGPATRGLLGGEVADTSSDKLAAVLANMEEWRWMPRSLGPTHVLVNVPSFSIVLTDNDEPVFEDRVVVGTPSTQTPIFSKDMTTIVLRPQWNLPDSIKLSALLTGRSIESQGYVVMRNGRRVDSSHVDWAKANLKQYEIFQPSGDDNALGLVKLLFPNKHSVYLHDTPSKHLFDEPVRLFSHGCMRVRNPQVLAQRIFDIDRGGAVPDVKRLVRNGPMNNQFTLPTPIPVHVGYFTVWVGADGQAQYFKDYYGHQKRITLALAGKWDQIDVGEDHLAGVDVSLLKKVKLGADKKDDDADTTVGVASSSGDSVGDLIRRSLGL